MKKLVIILIIFTNSIFANAQVQLYSWIRNLTAATGYNNIPSNVQSIYYTSSDVYISATCIPGYSIGPWTGNPNIPVNQNFVYKITRNPVQNTGTATTIGLGHIGVWTNGVSVFNVSDAMSYNNQGVWYRNAYFWEGSGFDNCLGHPAPGGEYHNHVNPTCLYDKNDNTRHSPIIGWAFDGYPIYGAWGYANTNGSGGIKRMISGYSITNPSATTRTNGPTVNTTYPLGCFLEDYSYNAATSDLDFRNGRFCVTPEYPGGTYAYFITLDANLNPAFPYTFYKSYYGIVQSGNTGGGGGHNTVPGTAVQYTTLVTPTIIISANVNSPCPGTAVTFSASVTNEGSAPVYQWKKNNLNIATGITYTTNSFSNGDQIKCEITSNAYYLTSSGATSNTITLNAGSCPVTLNLKLFIVGFYKGHNLMTGILSSSITDTIQVKLASSSAPHAILYSQTNVISTSGIGAFEFPSSSLNGSYYIVVKHRNALETWSAQPVNFNTTTISYDFTNALSKAYGNNQCDLTDGNFAFWSGDVSDVTLGRGYQDGVIESQDYSDEENATSITMLGYVPEDLTGDGIVESEDYSLIEGNVFYTRTVARP